MTFPLMNGDSVRDGKERRKMAIGKLGFGLMRLPVNSSNPADIDQKQLEAMVDLFLEKGFTYFDTSYVYHNGESETAVRKALAERHDRSSFVLASKLPAFLIQKESEVGTIFEEQLKKCGVSYFDYFLLHNLNKILYNGMDGKGGTVKTCHMFEAMKKWKDEGKIRHIGFSFHDDAETLDQILGDHPEVEFVQIALNYYDYESPFLQAGKCYEVIRRHGCEMVVMEPVKGGMLASVPEKIEDKMKAVWPNLSPASWAIRFAAGFDGTITVLSGMSTLSQMQDNLSCMTDYHPLSETERKILDEAVSAYHAKWPLKLRGMEELQKILYHGIPAAAIIDSYNSCQIQPNPGFAADLNYYKGQLARNHYGLTDELPKEKVVLADGTDVTAEVERAEKWLIEHSF